MNDGLVHDTRADTHMVNPRGGSPRPGASEESLITPLESVGGPALSSFKSADRSPIQERQQAAGGTSPQSPIKVVVVREPDRQVVRVVPIQQETGNEAVGSPFGVPRHLEEPTEEIGRALSRPMSPNRSKVTVLGNEETPLSLASSEANARLPSQGEMLRTGMGSPRGKGGGAWGGGGWTQGVRSPVRSPLSAKPVTRGLLDDGASSPEGDDAAAAWISKQSKRTEKLLREGEILPTLSNADLATQIPDRSGLRPAKSAQDVPPPPKKENLGPFDGVVGVGSPRTRVLAAVQWGEKPAASLPGEGEGAGAAEPLGPLEALGLGGGSSHAAANTRLDQILHEHQKVDPAHRQGVGQQLDPIPHRKEGEKKLLRVGSFEEKERKKDKDGEAKGAGSRSTGKTLAKLSASRPRAVPKMEDGMVMMVGAQAFMNASRRHSMPDGGVRGWAAAPGGPAATVESILAGEELSVLRSPPGMGSAGKMNMRAAGRALPGMRRPGTCAEVSGGARRGDFANSTSLGAGRRPNTVGDSVSVQAGTLQQSKSADLFRAPPGQGQMMTSLKELSGSLPFAGRPRGMPASRGSAERLSGGGGGGAGAPDSPIGRWGPSGSPRWAENTRAA